MGTRRPKPRMSRTWTQGRVHGSLDLSSLVRAEARLQEYVRCHYLVKFPALNIKQKRGWCISMLFISHFSRAVTFLKKKTVWAGSLRVKSKCRSKYRNLLLCMSNFHICICKCSAYIRAGRRLSSNRRGGWLFAERCYKCRSFGKSKNELVLVQDSVLLSECLVRLQQRR